MVYETFDDNFTTINSNEGVYTFLRDKIGEELLEQNFFGSIGLPQLRLMSYMVGPIRVMQMRTKSKKCKKIFNDDVNS